MAIPFRRKIRITFLKWHRAVGLFAGLFVIILVVTGIALNHGNELKLDQTPASKTVLSFYGIEITPPETGFLVNQQWLVESQKQLFFDVKPIGPCMPPFVGGAQVDGVVIAVCQDSLYLLTMAGDIVETTREIPEPLIALATADNRVFIKGQFNAYLFDTDAFTWQASKGQQAWIQAQKLPGPLANAIAEQSTVHEISWERFLLDLHSGRILGTWGVWFVDFVAIALAILAISGIWLRLSRPTKK